MFWATSPNTVYAVRCAHTNSVFGTTSHTPRTNVIRHSTIFFIIEIYSRIRFLLFVIQIPFKLRMVIYSIRVDT